jgi:hypothetical protein
MTAQAQQHKSETEQKQPGQQEKAQSAAPLAMPVQLKAKATQLRQMSGQDSFLEPNMDASAVSGAAQAIFARGPSISVRGVDLTATGIAGDIEAFVNRCITTKEPQYDSGYRGGGLGIIGVASRVVLTVDITNERVRNAQNSSAQTTGGQTAGSGNNQSQTTTTTGGVSGEVSGGNGKAGASGSVAQGNTSGSTTSGSGTGGGNYGTIMEDVDIAFTIRCYTQDTGVGSVLGGISGALGGPTGTWSGSGRATGGHAILRKPDPNRPT